MVRIKLNTFHWPALYRSNLNHLAGADPYPNRLESTITTSLRATCNISLTACEGLGRLCVMKDTELACRVRVLPAGFPLRQNQHGSGTLTFWEACESAQYIHGSFLRLQFCAEQNHRGPWSCSPSGANGVVIDLLRFRHPPVVIHRITCQCESGTFSESISSRIALEGTNT